MSIKLYWRQATLPDEATLARLSPQRRDRVLRCHNSETAAGIAAAGLLLAEYVADEEALLRTPEGKPYLPGGPEFSLSHGGDLAVLLISDTPCGVDVMPRAASNFGTAFHKPIFPACFINIISRVSYIIRI